jgi:predicted ATPase with chaperone activity
MVGPPGSAETMLARGVPTILSAPTPWVSPAHHGVLFLDKLPAEPDEWLPDQWRPLERDARGLILPR